VNPNLPSKRSRKPTTHRAFLQLSDRTLWPPALAVALASVTALAGAQDITFPADSGVLDVTKPPYAAKGDGKTDDTEPIQKAIATRSRIIYLPNGTYLISNTLRWTSPWKRIVFQGESMEKTIVKLKDACPGYTDPAHPKSMIWTGERPAQRFRNGLRDITFDTGNGNPGGIGIQYIANNEGSMRGVAIRSGDGKGVIGLDLGYSDEQGPCLIKNIYVSGFDVGISTRYGVDSIVFEHVSLSGQKKTGFVNDGQCLSIRGLNSSNSVTAFANTGAGGVVTLVDSQLVGTGNAGSQPAVVNNGAMLARNVRTSGYALALQNQAGARQHAVGPTITEFTSHEVLSTFDSLRKSLNLPIRETPEIPWGDPAKDWVSVTSFLPPAGDSSQDRTSPDCTEAFQKAIDSGHKTVYFPVGRYTLGGTTYVRGKVERIIGLESSFTPHAPGRIVIADGDSPSVVLERFDFIYANVQLLHASRRTLVLESITGADYTAAHDAGDVFIEDVCMRPWTFHARQHVWARQLNAEGPTTEVTNDGGTLWILGLKTEGDGALVETSHGGQTEVLGGFAYANTAGSKPCMFRVLDSSLSATLGESVLRRQPFQDLVEHWRQGQEQRIPRDRAPRRGLGSMFPLVTAYSEQEKNRDGNR
jgi:Pectate lyase superfamily protein